MFAIIMAGGSGTRFWPASREHLPKQFLRITSGRTLFEETLDRMRPLMPDQNIYVVVNRAHEEITHRLVGRRQARILVEPVGRNTAACIGLAALHVPENQRDEPMVVLPSDHFIADTDQFVRSLSVAADLSRTGAIVLLGIPPTRPETGYGYIEVETGPGYAGVDTSRRMKQFVEKPDPETALSYLSTGRHLWNAGIFISNARTLLIEIERCMPALHDGLRELAKSIGQESYAAAVAEIYSGLESISIDYGIMEKTCAPIYVLPGNFGWSDIGSWQALYDLRRDQADTRGNLLPEGAVTLHAEGNLVFSDTRRLVALLGVQRLVIVDTPDALLVADLNRSQDVKKLTEILKEKGRRDIC
ncbi:MAG: NTP transferase domain-containing protein [Acidobacteria bacterium]|nr:NTP transferase domain-containing protein [Acidobacteriota bacterium]MBI3657001.1 NTP transferase domain-containing protein [Acidobacteriota bacterium]